MSAQELHILAPHIIVAAASVLCLLAVSFFRRHALAALIAAAALAGALGALWQTAGGAPVTVASLLAVDRYAQFFSALVYGASFAVVVFSYGYFRGREGQVEEFYVLVLLAALGAAVLTMACHFASLFLGLEILSVSLYALIAYLWQRERSVEAGLKYLILAAASSAFLLFGMALLYAATGSMEFTAQARALGGSASAPVLALAAVALMTAGAGFKLAVAPFHMWTPDVYEGAPAPAVAFVATVSKGAMFALLYRFFFLLDGKSYPAVYAALWAMAAASMFTGNLMALGQRNVKRVLACSSIAHLGYLLAGFTAGGDMAAEASIFYIATYMIATLGAFGIVTVLSDKERDADSFDDYQGLFWRRPLIAAAFTLMLLSLAGIPLTAGFLGKFYVVAAGAGAGSWTIVALVAVNSVIGLYYYLKIIVAMFARPDELRREKTNAPSYTFAAGAALLALAFLTLGLGVIPGGLMWVIRALEIAR
ncbi:MAG: NADH-quinone oxidoreductase subunit N [Spirochaetes bacterium]|nr:MAG: NADH-quinone oxidoreductase subunit N [Spirochaetota bacterium]